MKVVFLDRDGVINTYPGDYQYVDSLEGFKFLPHSCEAIAKLSRAGYKIFVISNQAGVTKGLYSQKVLDSITAAMMAGVERSGGHIEQVFYCIHTDEQNCECRKPKIGLIKKVLEKYPDIENDSIFFVGDSIRDVKTGENAGCRTILVLSGKESIANKASWEIQPDFIAQDLLEAADIVIAHK